jgi:imidazolonepropionase-like amidohydrolase
MQIRGRVFDGTNKIELAEIGINEATGLIDYIDEVSSLPKRSADNFMDSTNVTILPGLIDTHIHFFGTEAHNLADWVMSKDVSLAVKSVYDSQKLLFAGFTAVRTMGDKVSLELSKAEKEGILLGPRIISSGFSIAETGGNDDPKFLSYEDSKRLSYSYYCDGPWECRKAVRLNIRNGAESIKAYSSRSFVGGGKIKDELTVEELSAISDEAHRASLKAASHAYGASAILNSVEAGFDSIEHGLGLTEELAEQMRKRGTFYVPTLSVYKIARKDVNEMRDAMIRQHIEKEVKIAQENGVKIAAGTDFLGTFDEPHGTNSKEVIYLSEIIGVENAIRAGTSIAAECLGLEKTGSIKKGFNGDIIAVKGDPFKDVSAINPENVVLVIKNGKIVKRIS